MRNSLIICLLALLFASATIDVHACWCRNDPEETSTEKSFRKTIKREVGSATFVFVGTLVEDGGKILRFKVVEAWKGASSSEITLPKQHKTPNGEEIFDSCSYIFEVGKKYLVYATDVTKSRALSGQSTAGIHISKCGRTTLSVTANRDIQELRRSRKSQIY